MDSDKLACSLIVFRMDSGKLAYSLVPGRYSLLIRIRFLVLIFFGIFPRLISVVR
jgi:hypothetical protein